MNTITSAPFEDVVTDITAGNIKIRRTEYLQTGKFPIIDQGQDFIGGYSNSESDLVQGQGPWIVFGDHTRSLKFVDFPFCMGADGVKVLRPISPEQLNLKYLYHFLAAHPVPSVGYSRHFKFLKRLLIPIPSLGTQQRIVAILDSADALRRKRRRTLELLDGLTSAIFSKIFVNTIPPVNARSKLPQARKGYEWALLTNVGRLATGHTPDRKRIDYWNGGIPWISLSDIRSLDGIIAETTYEKVTQDGIDNSSSVLLPEGTVCLSRTASVGFVTIMGRAMATSQDFVNWVCGPRILPEYLMWALIASRSELCSLAPGSIHKTIYFPTVESLQVLLPPLNVQADFVEKSRSVSLELAKLRPTIKTLDQLFASLQHRAFTGQL